MGFTDTVSLGYQAFQSFSSFQEANAQAKQLKTVADRQEQIGNSRANRVLDNALTSNRTALREKERKLSSTRLKAAAGNLAPTGSAHVRERDLATRLQDDIATNTDKALQDVSYIRDQSNLSAYNTRVSAYKVESGANKQLSSDRGSLYDNIMKIE